MPVNICSNREITTVLIEEIGLESPSELARRLDVTRQSVANYASKDKIDINNRIISELIEMIKTSKEER